MAAFSLMVAGGVLVAAGYLLRLGWLASLAEGDVFSLEEDMEEFVGGRTVFTGGVVVFWGGLLSAWPTDVVFWLGLAAVSGVFYWTYLDARKVVA